MKKCERVALNICLATLLASYSFSLSWVQAQVKPKSPVIIEKGTTPTPSVAPKPTPQKTPTPQACIDLKVALSFATKPSGTTGTVNLRGDIRNIGFADYVSPPGALVADYYVDTRHPPLTYGQEGVGSIQLSRRPIPTIARGGVFSINQSYTVPNFVQWGQRAPLAGERQAVCKFTLLIDNPSGGTISKSDDCVQNNNSMTTVELAYMEKSAPSGTSNPAVDESASRIQKPGEARWINPQPEPPGSPDKNKSLPEPPPPPKTTE